jgi:hypothetical protein
MNARIAWLAVGLCVLGLAGCSLDASPSGRGFAQKDGGTRADGGTATPLDAGHDAARPRDAGVDASHDAAPSHVDAGHDAGQPKDDAGGTDAQVDAGHDAGPPPLAPPLLITDFAGGSLSFSTSYIMRSSVGALRPTHSPVAPTGFSASEHYRLNAGLALAAP